MLTPEELKVVAAGQAHTVPQVDAAYDPIRDMVSVLHLDLAKLNQ